MEVACIENKRGTSNPLSKLIFLLAFLYVYLFSPNFLILGIGSIKILLFISSCYFAIRPKTLIALVHFQYEALFIFLLIIYSAITAVRVHDISFKVPYVHFIWFLEGFIIPLFLIKQFKSLFLKYSWESLIVSTGFLASIITLLLIAFPDWNYYLRTQVIDSLDADEFAFRGFAIAESVSFSYGVIQGLILGICFYFSDRNKWYSFPILFLLISIIFNARIGLAVGGMALLLSVIKGKVKVRAIFLLTFLILVAILLNSQFGFSELNAETIKWGLSFFTETGGFISGNKEGFNTYEVLEDMIYFPPDVFSLFFGTGALSANSFGRDSDIGYVTQIFYGGIFYLVMMLGFLFFMFIRIWRNSNDKFYAFLFLATLLIVNFKWDSFFVPTGFFRLFTLYYVYLILLKENVNSKPLFKVSLNNFTKKAL